ncbi:glycine rich protein [Halorubrum tailed virus 27]|uniref:Glycine rich protein n=1 Tax=Halorubrum tailed virus 27 TaxID=2878008 RepID=A0AAE8XXX0_9CAUD|nr:glycine rich protein [Halorubrum tailed virus 27]UBF22725.1 glycine rich protein [Halorubrum tailed virus 27]
MVLDKIPTMDDVREWVNNNANVPNAAQAENADTVQGQPPTDFVQQSSFEGDVRGVDFPTGVKTGESRIYVGASPPPSENAGDIWINNSGSTPSLVMASSGGFVGEKHTFTPGQTYTHEVRDQYSYLRIRTVGGAGASGSASGSSRRSSSGGGRGGYAETTVPTSQLGTNIEVHVATDANGKNGGDGWRTGGSAREQSDHDDTPFALGGGGGGASAVLNGTTPIIVGAGGGGGGAVSTRNYSNRARTSSGGDAGKNTSGYSAYGQTVPGATAGVVNGNAPNGDSTNYGNDSSYALSAGGGGAGRHSGEGGNADDCRDSSSDDQDYRVATGGAGGDNYVNGGFSPGDTTMGVTTSSPIVELIYLEA